MKKILIPVLLLVLIALLFLFWKPTEEKKPLAVTEPNPIFQKEGELYFLGEENDTISRIDIEIADDRDAITQGLMYRKAMPDSLGMLFIFPNERSRSFWMKNTYIPLDIIYVNEEMEIVSIRENNPPLSERSIPSDGKAKYVVEVIGGYTYKKGVEEGDKINFQRL